MYIPPPIPPQSGVGPTETPADPSDSPGHPAASVATDLLARAVEAVTHGSTGQHLDRPPATLTRRLSSPNQTNVTVGIVIGVVLAFFIISSCTFLYIYRDALRRLQDRRYRRYRRRRHKSTSSRNSKSSADSGPPPDPPPAAEDGAEAPPADG